MDNEESANSLTAPKMASRAEVARRSCSSAPRMPEVGISRASCEDSSGMSLLRRLMVLPWATSREETGPMDEQDQPGLNEEGPAPT
jgi:hypothetical protein